jgi:hypothetical protein
MLVLGLEPVVSRHPLQQILDAAGAGVGDSGTVGIADDDLFVLGSNPPLRARLAAFLEVPNQVLFLFKQLTHESNPSRISEKEGAASALIMASANIRGKQIARIARPLF